MSDPNEHLWTGGSGAPQPAPGWYPDPSGIGGQRYWDGTQWTEHMQTVAPPPPPMPVYASRKSPGLAVFLSILWIGTGHFYAGRSDATPIVLVCVNLFLILLTLTCLIGVIPWIPLMIWSAIDAHGAAVDFNRRHGL